MGYKTGQKFLPHGLRLRKSLIKNHTTLFRVELSRQSDQT